MKVKLRLAMLVVISVAIAGCRGDDVYTLYRFGQTEGGEFSRIHVASIDSVDGSDFNSSNCEIARGLFQNQGGATVNWCEKGKSKQ